MVNHVDRLIGIPRSDVERVVNHYGVDLKEAEYWLTLFPVNELLPERGTGLVYGTANQLRKVSFKPTGSVVGFPGMEFTIDDAWVDYKGNRVTEVPVGASFRVKVKYSCNWPEKPWYQPTWVVSLTASAGWELPQVEVYDNTEIIGASGSGTMTLDNPQPAVMPDVDIVLGIQPWGSSNPGDYWSPPPKPW